MTKICSKCRKEKPRSEFYKRKNRKDPHRSDCKECSVKANRERPRQKINRKYWLKRYFNLTFEQYNKMFEQQNGVCAICGKPELKRNLSVDHNHKTKKIRGLLCLHCNAFLGRINDSQKILKRTIKYLQKGA